MEVRWETGPGQRGERPRRGRREVGRKDPTDSVKLTRAPYLGLDGAGEENLAEPTGQKEFRNRGWRIDPA